MFTVVMRLQQEFNTVDALIQEKDSQFWYVNCYKVVFK